MSLSRRGFLGTLAAIAAGAKALSGTKESQPVVEAPKPSHTTHPIPHRGVFDAPPRSPWEIETIDVEMIADADLCPGDIVQAVDPGHGAVTHVKPVGGFIKYAIVMIALKAAKRGERVRCRIKGECPQIVKIGGR